jgi:hypothetical protein
MPITSPPPLKKQQRKPRWYQCSPRLLVSLGVVAVIGLCYAVVTIHDGRMQKAAAEEIKKAGGTVQSEPALLARLLGGDAVARVTSVSLTKPSTSDDVLVHVERFGQLESLWLNNTQVTDDGLAHLEGLSRLQDLRLANTKVTDVGIIHLEGLSRLQSLWLQGTKVTDTGLARLEGLTQLRDLWLHKTAVTDQGIKRLQQALPKCDIKH